jgi:hypothetical protein
MDKSVATIKLNDFFLLRIYGEKIYGLKELMFYFSSPNGTFLQCYFPTNSPKTIAISDMMVNTGKFSYYALWNGTFVAIDDFVDMLKTKTNQDEFNKVLNDWQTLSF